MLRKWTYLLILCAWAMALRVSAQTGSQAPASWGRMLVLDVGRGMMQADIKPSRLGAVKMACEEWLTAQPGDHAGIIAFTDKPVLLAAPGRDLQANRQALESASPSEKSDAAASGEALAMAVRQLKPLPDAGKRILLITDGRSQGGRIFPLMAGHDARAAHIRINVIVLSLDEKAIAQAREEYLKLCQLTEGRLIICRSYEELFLAVRDLEKGN